MEYQQSSDLRSLHCSPPGPRKLDNAPGRSPPELSQHAESGQSVRRRRRARCAQHLTVDAPAEASVEESQPKVDGNGSLPAVLLDQGTNLDQQLAGGLGSSDPESRCVIEANISWIDCSRALPCRVV